MHFPTSLPPSTGSPAAKLVSHSGGFHSDHPVAPKIRRIPIPETRSQNSLKRPAVPVYAYNKTEFTLPGIGPRRPRGLPKKSIMKTMTKDIDPLQPPFAPTQSSILDGGASVPGVDGAEKLFHNAEAKAKSKFKSIRGPEFRRIFSRKEEVKDDSGDSPTEAAEFNEMKRQKSNSKSPKPSEHDKGSVSPRAILAARFLRTRGKDIETGLDLNDEDHHPLEGAKRRIDNQRQRKMRRFKGGTKTKESDLPEGHIPPEEHSPRSKHHVAEKIHKTISLAKPREQLDAYKTSRRQEKDEIEDDNGGSRIGNAVRRMSEQFMPNEDEKEAETRRASWTQPLDSRPQSRKNSAQVDIGSSSSSSPPKVHHDIVPTNMSPKEYSSSLPQMGPMNTIDSTSDEHSLYGFSDVQPRSPYNQPLYPPRPMAPFFRPTLSPVSSRSPVPTSTLHAASSPKPAKQKEPSKSVSISPQARSVVQDPSASSLHLPLPDVPASGSPIPISPIPPGLTVRNGAPNSPASSISGVSANKVALLSPIIETSSPEVLVSGAQKRPTVTAEDKIPQLDLSKESVNYTNTQSNLPAPKTVTFETPPKKKYSHQKTSVNSSSVSSAQFSEINRPQSPPPNRTPSPIKIAAITPSTSALEFWKEADESLHPSESASAQPPNYRGEPPPNFWKDADKNFRAQKHGPTMEEWIASLPGLGLGLGPWGNSDGALDLKYFQNLKATRKLQKRGSQRSIKTQELIRKNIENAEKAIEEIEVEGLTPEEAEAIISDDENEREVSTANQPPELIDPTLLHPNYTPGSSTASLPVSRKSTLPRPVSSANPQGRLGKDAASRLTAMEKYWDEQSSQMGTVLKRMLVVIDGLIIKEREESQKQTRGVQMGWFDSDDDGVYTKDEQTSELSNTDGVVAKSEWGCSVA